MRNTGLLIVFMILALVLPCSLNIALGSQDADMAVIDSFIARQAKRERGEEYREARKVVAGDLTHDGDPETVVLYTIEGQRGSNLYVQYLAIFVRRKGKLSALTHADVGGKSMRGVELKAVENNSIVLDTLNYGPKDASCCPSVKGTTSYVLSAGTLREIKGRKSASRRSNDTHPTHQADHLMTEFPIFAQQSEEERLARMARFMGIEEVLPIRHLSEYPIGRRLTLGLVHRAARQFLFASLGDYFFTYKAASQPHHLF